MLKTVILFLNRVNQEINSYSQTLLSYTGFYVSFQVNTQAPFSLEKQLSSINRLFSIDTKNVETILEQLKSDGSEFALKQVSILEKMVRSSASFSIQKPFRLESHIT